MNTQSLSAAAGFASIRKLRVLLAVALCSVLAALFACCSTAFAADASTHTVHATMTYGQTEARGMLSGVNEFRMGDDAWYWNSDNTTKTTCTNLGKLTYDYTLEKIAMLRAKEIALSYNMQHNRANGKAWSTAYSECGVHATAMGENLATGEKTADEALTEWKEENKNYSGQGHRRNMLDSEFNAIGIAHVVYQGADYWVQEFACVTTPNTTVTPADDSTATMSVDVLDSKMEKIEAAVDSSPLQLLPNSSCDLPSASIAAKITDYFSSDFSHSTCALIPDSVTWSSSDESVAKIDGSSVRALKNGTATLTCTLSFCGAEYTKEIPITVSNSVADGSFTLSQTSFTYTGKAIEPTVSSAAIVSTSLTEGTDYEVSYKNNVNAGTGTVVITGKGNYSGTKEISFTIDRQSINSFRWSVGGVGESSTSGDFSGYLLTRSYNGAVQAPNISMSDGEVTLVQGQDFVCDFGSNTPKDVGAYDYKITGIGNYCGTISLGNLRMQINAPSLSYLTVIVDASDCVYNGSAYTPAVTVKIGDYVIPASDYTVAYADNVDAGTAKVTVSAASLNVTDSASRTFTIKPASIQGMDAALSSSAYTYDGSAKEPAVSIDGLTEGTDYTVSYVNNTDAGKATATITGKGNYTGTLTKEFTINPASIDGATVSVADATYDGNAQTPAPTVKKGGVTLKAGTDYAVSYANNTSAGKATATITGKGNYAGSKQVDFTIAPADIAGQDISLATSEYTYDGTAKEPAATVKGLKQGTDFIVTYADNTNAGTASATVTGIGNYTGTVVEKFAINPANIEGLDVTLAQNEFTYDGSAKQPAVAISGLAQGTDFTAAYDKNVNAGKAAVTITGAGNYTGTIEKLFVIKPASIQGMDAELSNSSYTYDGTAKEPTVSISGLKAGADYAVAYADNVNAGSATVTITGQGNYAGSITKSFAIAKADIGGLKAELASSEFTYDGEAKEPVVAIEGLKAGTDYTVSYANNTNAGQATTTVVGKDNYTGSQELTFTINRTDIAGATLDIDKSGVTNAEPAVTVTLNGRTLVEGADYTVAYADAAAKGSRVATVEGKGNYAGSASAEFAYLTKDEKQGVDNAADSISALPSADDLTLADADKVEAAQQAYDNLSDAQKQCVNAESIAKLQAASQKIAALKQAEQERAAAEKNRQAAEKAAIKLSRSTYTYTGNALRPAVTVTAEGKKLANGLDYTVSYANNKNVGKATAEVVFAGKYTGANPKTATFIINPKGTSVKKLTAAKKALTVKWAKQSKQTTGYQLRYSLKKSMSKAKAKTVKGATKTSYKLKKLSGKKRYYVQVRTYKTVGGKTYYSSWSKALSAKTK